MTSKKEKKVFAMKNCNDLQREILDRDLCCFCGTCAGICPASKIDTQGGKILFNQAECVNCGLCVRTCPGGDFNFPLYNEILFSDESCTESEYVGKYQRILKGCAKEPEMREKASSGGVVTAVALYLLRERKVDGVVAVVPSPHKINAYEPRILKTEAEVRESAQSKYTLIPVNTIIREILDHEGTYLFIGLPCQIQGLRKAMEASPRLASRIYMCIAVFCGFNMEQKATDYLIKKSKLPPNEIKSIQYRGKSDGKTGFLIRTDKKAFFISKHGYTLLNAFFSPSRCWKCYDLAGEFADLSCGDAWEMGGGWTRIITRSHMADQVIDMMVKEEWLEISESSEDEILNSQAKIVSYKKRGISVREKMFPPFPQYNTSFAELSKGEKTKAFFFGLCLKIGKTPLASLFLRILPIRLFEHLSCALRKDDNKDPAEVIRYLFWGIVTILTNLVSFTVLRRFGVGYKIANLASIIITKLTAFFSNKKFVFRSHNKKASETIKEAVRFLFARGFTGVVEFMGLIFWVDFLNMPELPGKILLLFITTVLNYILGKKFVFTKKE